MSECSNGYNPYPNEFSIRCPKCASEAIFRFPYSTYFADEHEANKIAAAHPGSIVSPRTVPGLNGNKIYYVVEYYPSLWTAKEKNNCFYNYQRQGSSFNLGFCSCASCKQKFKHRLRWPHDAYYILDIRGKILWAWSIEHVRVLAAYVSQKQRNPSDYRQFCFFLWHIPGYFLQAKNRELVIKKATLLIEQNNAKK